jgi:hypothetical protein
VNCSFLITFPLSPFEIFQMAERPIFIPCLDGDCFVREVSFDFAWNPGFAPIQKKKNIAALHQVAAADGFAPLLEVSTKSDERLGQRLSAFSLKVKSPELGDIPLESAFQGSKVFEKGGPFTDLYRCDSRTAKKDERVRNSGPIVEFRFGDLTFPREPKTAFYDWLYISALYPHRDFLRALWRYVGFTDIEFNPQKSINCQARSCALFSAMLRTRVLEDAVQSPDHFIAAMRAQSASPLIVGESQAPDGNCLF